MFRVLSQRVPGRILRVRPRQCKVQRSIDIKQLCSGPRRLRGEVQVFKPHQECILRLSHTGAVSSTLESATGSETTNVRGEDPGEMLYQQAMKVMEEAKALEAQKEQERSQKMYEAWEKAEETESNNPKSSGVKVVQTLVKETRKERKRRAAETDEFLDALRLLEEAAQKYEHPEALVQLGNISLQTASKKGNEPAEMISEALSLFERAGVAGSRVGWYNLGQLYWTGYPAATEFDGDDDVPSDELLEPQILEKNIGHAMEAFEKAIEMGDLDAMYLVGVNRMTSEARESIQSGFDLIKNAADVGHSGAKYYIALVMLNGEPTIGIKPCSLEEFPRLLDDAVEAGNVDALFTRGHSYYHGTEGYPQNYDRALESFLIAADGGHADAAVSAGAMLHTGTGVPKDQRRAFELYQHAGELGSKEGWQNVVACYMTGEGVPQSLETARYIRETVLNDKIK